MRVRENERLQWRAERMRRMREDGRKRQGLCLFSSLLSSSAKCAMFSSYSRKERSLRVSFLLLLSFFSSNPTYTETRRCLTESVLPLDIVSQLERRRNKYRQSIHYPPRSKVEIATTRIRGYSRIVNTPRDNKKVCDS